MPCECRKPSDDKFCSGCGRVVHPLETLLDHCRAQRDRHFADGSDGRSYTARSWLAKWRVWATELERVVGERSRA